MLLKRQKSEINLNPIQRGGILTKEGREALIEFGDGYATYDLSPGLEIEDMPIIKNFIEKELPEFLESDIAKFTLGAREGIFNVMHCITKPGDTIIVDGNRHYSTITAAERCKLNIVEVKNSGKPEYKINIEDYENLIKKHKPSMILLTYPDGNYGNIPDAKKLGTIAKKYEVPYLINGAYSVGRMPISMKKLGADFIIGSCHKSMASSGPLGILGANKKWEKILFKKSELVNKQIEFIGSESRGTAVATLIASFPKVKKRIENWDEEVEKAKYFSSEIEKLGIMQLGEKPHNHDLLFFEAPVLYEISQKHKKRGYFLHQELKKRGISGIKAGLTKNFKISTYQLTKKELDKVVSAFKEIIDENL
ncbi:MAG: O-phospho-L-seryl-tRNA:Cys-tRNA synthase [Candidatus Aenigmatarchaeota archaeon]|nr:MAG: O-phospho-L-seryl-tRNA:Cys-tRNA synthase [Candidatus Aenigmarchaeota archaeon]